MYINKLCNTCDLVAPEMGEPGVVEVARDDDVGPVPLTHRGARVKRLQTDCLKCIFNQTASNAGFFLKKKRLSPSLQIIPRCKRIPSLKSYQTY